MYYALTVDENNIITGVHGSQNPIVEETFQHSPDYYHQTLISIEDKAEYSMGADVRCYDDTGKHKPLDWCIEQGYVELRPIDDAHGYQKNLYRRCRNGIRRIYINLIKKLTMVNTNDENGVI